MTTRRGVRAVVGSVAVLVASLASGSVAGAAGPSLSVSPLRVEPDEPVAITVTDCPEAPEISVGESDFIRLVAPTPTGPGSWTASLDAGLTDWRVSARCGDVELGPVEVDIDNPLIGFNPIGSFLPNPDPPTAIYGSDCPDGTVATVRFDEEVLGRPTATGTPVTAPIDERGDWQVDTPIYTQYAVVPPPGTPAGTVLREFTVHASCGDVVYEVLRIPIQRAVGDEPTTTTTSAPTTTSVPSDVPVPPAATPQPGNPSFTG